MRGFESEGPGRFLYESTGIIRHFIFTLTKLEVMRAAYIYVDRDIRISFSAIVFDSSTAKGILSNHCCFCCERPTYCYPYWHIR